MYMCVYHIYMLYHIYIYVYMYTCIHTTTTITVGVKLHTSVPQLGGLKWYSHANWASEILACQLASPLVTGDSYSLGFTANNAV